MQKIEYYAPSVLRHSMAAVMLWFSFQQFMNATVWTAYVPDSAVSLTHLSAVTLVYINAIIEAVLGLALVFSRYTRLAALLLALHLFDIMYIVGYGEIGVRDFGLAFGTLVVAMNAVDPLASGYRSREVASSVESVPLQERPRPLIR